MFLAKHGSWTPRRILLTIGIGGVGIYTAWLGFTDWYTGVRSSTWPTTTGSVLESEVERIPGSGRTKSGYRAHLRYRYQVTGQTYFGNRASFGRLALGSGQAIAESVVRQYPTGSAVEVHYNPAQPDESVLQVGWTWSAVLRATLGIVLLVSVLVLGGRRHAAA